MNDSESTNEQHPELSENRRVEVPPAAARVVFQCW